jgi:hypothetical protein
MLHTDRLQPYPQRLDSALNVCQSVPNAPAYYANEPKSFITLILVKRKRFSTVICCNEFHLTIYFERKKDVNVSATSSESFLLINPAKHGFKRKLFLLSIPLLCAVKFYGSNFEF